MSFGLVLLNVLSLCFLVAIIAVSFFRWKAPGAIHFGVLVFFSFLWSLGTFLELSVRSFEAKLLWRNFTQIGTFYLPVATVIFALAHTGTSRRVIRRACLILIGWQIIPVLLIWTDGLHHLMRVSVSLGEGISGISTLVVRQSAFGMVCVSINYALMAVGVLVLLVSAIRMTATRTSLVLVAVGLAIPSVFSGLTNIFGPLAFGGIPAATSFAAGGAVALVGIQYFGFLKLTPIARDRAFDVIDEGILVCDVDGKVVDLNHAARSMLSRHYPLPGDAPAAEFGQRLSKTLNTGIPELCAREEMRFSLRLGDGDDAGEDDAGDAKAHYALRSYELRNDRRLIGYTSVLQDVSDDTRRMNRLLERAERDPLTGIYNKRAFNEIVTSLLERGPAGNGFLMVFDIDHFKGFNDEHGHLSGDRAILEVCRRCRDNLRDGDVFGRVGGDEFALFLSGLDSGAACALAERIREAVASRPVDLEMKQAALTISAGVAESGSGGSASRRSHSFEELFERADAALYKAKAAGRNRVTMSA